MDAKVGWVVDVIEVPVCCATVVVDDREPVHEGVEQALHKLDVPVKARLLREMIKIDRDRLGPGGLDDRLNVSEQAIVGHALVIEWRQHERAGKV